VSPTLVTPDLLDRVHQQQRDRQEDVPGEKAASEEVGILKDERSLSAAVILR
jgi:hypothetical protein